MSDAEKLIVPPPPWGRWLPKHHFHPVKLISVIPSCDETKESGLALRLADGSQLRVRLSVKDANCIQGALQEDYDRRNACQSPISSGSPSVEGSVVPGQSQCPPVRSSNAACGDE